MKRTKIFIFFPFFIFLRLKNPDKIAYFLPNFTIYSCSSEYLYFSLCFHASKISNISVFSHYCARFCYFIVYFYTGICFLYIIHICFPDFPYAAPKSTATDTTAAVQNLLYSLYFIICSICLLRPVLQQSGYCLYRCWYRRSCWWR